MKYATDIEVINKNICKVIEEAKKINRVITKFGNYANLENRNFCILRKSRLFKNKTKIFKIYFGVKYIVIDSMEMVKKY